ncbi:MAG: hypothetical protein ACD_8C00140G0001, partial [uncultured bacterium]
MQHKNKGFKLLFFILLCVILLCVVNKENFVLVAQWIERLVAVQKV